MNKIVIGEYPGTSYAVTNGARTITLSGLSFTPIIEQFAYIYNKTQDLLYYAPAEGVAKCTLSGSVVTIDSSFAVLATGDELHIQVWSTVGFDADQDNYKNSIQNPSYAHRVYGSQLIDASDLAVTGDGGTGGDGAAGAGDNYYYLVDMETYRKASFNFLTTTGAGNTFTIDLYATENPDAVTSPNTAVTLAADGWKDIAALHAGVAQLTTAAGQTNQVDRWEIEVTTKYLLVQVLVVTGGAEDNSLDAWVSKSY